MLLLLSCCERLTDFFISQCGLPETRRSWYIYALQTRISMFLSTAGMMLLGCLVATPYQVICFLVGILTLRRRLGGYHAKTPLRCLFLSIGVSTVSYTHQMCIRDRHIPRYIAPQPDTAARSDSLTRKGGRSVQPDR